MDFDQMLDAWKAQDDKPLYGVNSDLLQLVLRHERGELRRALRREQWTTYIMGIVLGTAAAVFLGAFLYFEGPALYTALAAVAAGAFALWVGALWFSRRCQALRERRFGSTLRDEIGRNLSLVDYQLSRTGQWGAGMLLVAPVLVGGAALYALSAVVNTNSGMAYWMHIWIIAVLLWSLIYVPYQASRAVKKKLEPRRRRELLDTLDGDE